MTDPSESKAPEGGPDGAKESTFLVTHAEAESAVMRDVDDGQVHTLSTNPGVDVDDAVEGVVAPEGPMSVTWTLVEVEQRRALTIERSPEPPTTQERDLAAEQDVGELTRRPRAGDGELHVVTVPEDETDSAVEELLADRETMLSRAARLGVERVELRLAPGVVSVRYMP